MPQTGGGKGGGEGVIVFVHSFGFLPARVWLYNTTPKTNIMKTHCVFGGSGGRGRGRGAQ